MTSGSNRLVEEFEPGFLSVTSRFQDQKYAPLSSKQLLAAINQQQHCRPPPHMVRQAFNEMYTAFNGYCNIQHESPAVMDMITQPRKGSAVPSAPGGVLGVLPSPSQSMEDFRLNQIRLNERHQNMKNRVCSYFTTREGCRRGGSCPFIHVEK